MILVFSIDSSMRNSSLRNCASARRSFSASCGSLHENDEVVRVPHDVEARPTTCVVGLQTLLRPLAGLIARVGNPAPVSLVDGRQIDVGQDRRDDAPLRSRSPDAERCLRS